MNIFKKDRKVEPFVYRPTKEAEAETLRRTKLREEKNRIKFGVREASDDMKWKVILALSIAVPSGISIKLDLDEAAAIFDAARTANNKFIGMSDSEIVSYCDGLNEASLTGMVSLVHGRYFENIVAESTGGILHEAKNHPDTDILLNGKEVSIKSNDDTADGIIDFTVLSPQDLGLDDKALYERTYEVMDGDIVNVGESLIDGGLGLGTVATLTAIGSSVEEWEKLSDYDKTKVRAVWIGAKTTGKASIGTVKSAWSLIKLTGNGLFSVMKYTNEHMDSYNDKVHRIKRVKNDYNIKW